MKNVRYKGSYTVEAAIYIPIILFMLFQSVEIAIDFLQSSREREVCEELQTLDIVKEFYGYQVMDEVREEIEND
jgi:hypothetical protein